MPPIGERLCAYLHSGDGGQSLVEFALVLPMLLILVFGVCSAGMAMIVYEQLGEAAFAGVQALSDNQGVLVSGSQVDLCAQAYTAVTTVLSAPSWSKANQNKITYSASFANTVGTTTTTTPVPASTGSFSCQTLSSDLGSNSQATLTLSYPFTWLPFYGTNFGTITMTRQQSILAQ